MYWWALQGRKETEKEKEKKEKEDVLSTTCAVVFSVTHSLSPFTLLYTSLTPKPSRSPPSPPTPPMLSARTNAEEHPRRGDGGS